MQPLQAFDPIPTPRYSATAWPAEPQGKVAYAFLLDVDHPPLPLEGLFEASALFDFHEASAHARLVVDVVEVTPTRTTLHVKPSEAMAYTEIAAEVATMVDRVGHRIFGGYLRASRLRWRVEAFGLPSPME